MSDGYQIRNQNGLHFLTMTIVGWIDVFAYLEYKNIMIPLILLILLLRPQAVVCGFFIIE